MPSMISSSFWIFSMSRDELLQREKNRLKLNFFLPLRCIYNYLFQEKNCYWRLDDQQLKFIQLNYFNSKIQIVHLSVENAVLMSVLCSSIVDSSLIINWKDSSCNYFIDSIKILFLRLDTTLIRIPTQLHRKVT